MERASVLEAAIVSEAPDLVFEVGLVICGGEVFRCHSETDGVDNSMPVVYLSSNTHTSQSSYKV